VNRDEQLEWEARWSRPAAAAAAFAALALVAGFAYGVSALEGNVGRGDRARLLRIDQNAADLMVIAGLNAMAVLGMAAVLVYLYRTAKPRRPELSQAALILAIAGPLLYVIVLIALNIVRIGVAGDFGSLPAGQQTDARAGQLEDDSILNTVGLVGLAPSLALGFAFVLISLSAMRAGLLSRFMGILGIIVGVLYVIPLLGGGPPVITIFWLGALAVLFLDRWPGGRGPAWAAGEAIPWPSAMEVAKAREEASRGAPPEEAARSAPPEEPAPARSRRKKRR
jgi:hypothetical protein